MADRDTSPLDVQLTPEATAMLRRHLLKCAEAGLPVTANSLCRASMQEAMRIEGTPAGAAREHRWKKYFRGQIRAAGPVVSKQNLQYDEIHDQFLSNRIASFAVIQYLTTVINGERSHG